MKITHRNKCGSHCVWLWSHLRHSFCLLLSYLAYLNLTAFFAFTFFQLLNSPHIRLFICFFTFSASLSLTLHSLAFFLHLSYPAFQTLKKRKKKNNMSRPANQTSNNHVDTILPLINSGRRAKGIKQLGRRDKSATMLATPEMAPCLLAFSQGTLDPTKFPNVLKVCTEVTSRTKVIFFGLSATRGCLSRRILFSP